MSFPSFNWTCMSSTTDSGAEAMPALLASAARPLTLSLLPLDVFPGLVLVRQFLDEEEGLAIGVGGRSNAVGRDSARRGVEHPDEVRLLLGSGSAQRQRHVSTDLLCADGAGQQQRRNPEVESNHFACPLMLAGIERDTAQAGSASAFRDARHTGLDESDKRSILRGKEFESSVSSGIRTRQFCGFFVPGIESMAGRATDKTPRKGEEVHPAAYGLSTSRPPRWGRVKAAPRGFSELKQERFMPTTAPVAPLNFVFATGALRAVLRDEAPWFVAADVCAALEIANVGNAVSRLDSDERATIRSTDSRPGEGAQSLTYVNESGLYSLILGSRKPQAKAFKRWVTHEVLPAIRKTGTYSIAPPQPEPIGPMMKLHVFVDPEIHRAFKTKCAVLGLTMRGEVNKLLEAYVGNFKAAQALEYTHE